MTMKQQTIPIPVPIADKPIVTARVGKNADIFVDILRLYAPEGSVIADVTFGRGWFWGKVPGGKYTILASDKSYERIHNPQEEMFPYCYRFVIDMERLPYRDESLDAIVIDPPYGKTGGANDGFGVVASYELSTVKSMVEVVKGYRMAASEAGRCLKAGGIAIVKGQDAIESGLPWWMHSRIRTEFEYYEFTMVDMFILVQEHTPIMRHKYQYHARKNHSFFLIFKRDKRQ